MSTIHATALLIGERALLIRGVSGAGKSTLALSLIREARHSPSLCVRLISDDRIHVEAVNGRAVARAPEPIAGMIEERARGLLEVSHEDCGVIGAVLDLSDKPQRLPEEKITKIAGVEIPCFFHPSGHALSLAKALAMIGNN